MAIAAMIASPPAAMAAPMVTPDPKTAIVITPHRAAYKLTLRSARNGSKVTGVRGGMTFEWADACEGWTTEQRFQLRFTYVEGDEMEMNTNYSTWESKAGDRYRFTVRKLVNGQLDEEVRGDASLPRNGDDGSIRYEKPERREDGLPAGTLFPSAHTVALLEKAAAGDKFFAKTVFDGTDDKGTVLVNAVIAPARSIESAFKSPLLKDARAWPIRMAFFPTASPDAAPDYEMTLHLTRDGIADHMEIDYGDFTVDAALERLEPLPKPGC